MTRQNRFIVFHYQLPHFLDHFIFVEHLDPSCDIVNNNNIIIMFGIKLYSILLRLNG